MHGRRGKATRGTATAVGVGCAVALAMLSAVAPTAGATAVRDTYTSFSYGSRVLVGSTVTSGPSATSQIGCTSAAPLSRTSDSAGAARKVLLVTGNVTTTAATAPSPVRSTSSAVVHGLKLLGGVVRSAVVESHASTTLGASGFSSVGSTTFANLVVGGRAVSRTVPPNTRRALPGLGYVILNQQTRAGDATSASLIVQAIHVVVTQPNGLGVATGTNVLVGHAMSGLSRPVVGFLGGEAYGTSATSSASARSDPKFKALMPCLGTGGRQLVDTGAQAGRAGVLTSGVDRNTAVGTDLPAGADARMTATVHDVSLLAGVLRASVVVAAAQVVDRGGRLRFDDGGSRFEGLSVPSDPTLGPSVPPDTVVTIPGVGTLYLHRVLRTAGTLEVRMIELVVTHRDVAGLALGSDVRIGVARVSLR